MGANLQDPTALLNLKTQSDFACEKHERDKRKMDMKETRERYQRRVAKINF